MKRLSIRWKLTLWYGGVLAVVLTLFSAVVYTVMSHQLMERIDQGLNEELADVLSEVHRHQDSASLLEWLNRRFAHHEGFDFEITDSNGERFFANPRLIEQSLSFADASEGNSPPRFETLSIGAAGRWRIVAVQDTGPSSPLTVKIGRSLATFEHETRELLFTFLLTGPITLLIAVSGGYFLARRALNPVHAITQTAKRISVQQLSERISVNNPTDELGILAETLNEMIERLERSFQEMRRFTADAAHELRTPLAVMRNDVEVTLRSSRSGEEYCRVLENVLDETNRLTTMADQLLFLCRQDAGLQANRQESIPMDDLLEGVVVNMQLVAGEKGVSLKLVANPSHSIMGDPRQLRSVFYNLLDNAIKYTPASGAISVTSKADNGQLVVVIADTGIGIPEEHLAKIFDRFYRVDPARSGDENGAGLGLSICQSVIRGMAGDIHVVSSVEQGTTITVRLPQQSFTSHTPSPDNAKAQS